jgi:5-formyltetrahydrofolate cyclo-ligase
LYKIIGYNGAMKTEKTAVRAQLKRRRLEMTDAERTIKSRAIVELLKDITDWAQIKSLHYFEPIKRLMEPDISDLITFLEDQHPKLKMFVPRRIGKEWDLVSVRGGEAPDKFDVILVPMLGFDEELNRIGYGGGYYDRLLATQPQAKKIGVCYEDGKTETVPVEDHDIRLAVVVTDKKTYN